jgi:hypothetical protein
MSVGLNTPHSRQINAVYNRTWWALVYAASPSYAVERGDLNTEVLPIEAQAEAAAVDQMVEKGVLER